VAQNKHNPTIKTFEERMDNVIKEIGVTVGHNDGARPRFPNFTLTDPIREKLRTASHQIANGEIHEAHNTLDDAHRHFRNQQAAYARNHLTESLQDQVAQMSRARYPEEILSPIRKAVEDFREMVFNDRFSLDDASNLYWYASGLIDGAKDALSEQQKNQMAEKRARQEEQDAVARQREVDNRKKLADKFLHKIDSV